MSHEPVSEEVRAFIQHYIDSVAQLEALLFLRANAGDHWDVTTTAKRLFAPEDQIARVLEKLTIDGFLKHVDNAYTYNCSDELRQKVDRLADAYRRFLIPVTNLIHGKLRGVREFSDAFRFRRDR